jgi:hypothetical protein
MVYIKWFLFLSRVTFISNIFFVVDLLLAFTRIELPQFIVGMALVFGWAPVSPMLNFITAFVLVLLLVKGIKNPAPLWLIGVNLFLFVIQTVYYLY